MKNITPIEMTWSVILFLRSAATIPNVIPIGTDIKNGKMLILIVLGSLERTYWATGALFYGMIYQNRHV